MPTAHAINSTPALVLGLSPTGLIVIRSLGRRGIPVFGADFNRWGIGRFSKYCRYHREISEISQQRDGNALCDALLEFARGAGSKPVLYITNDDYIELLQPYFSKLKDLFLFSTNLDGNSAKFLDKKSFYTLCRQHEVELPQTYFPESADDVRAISREIHYPGIIKPAFIHHFRNILRGKKVVQVFDAEQLVRNYETLAKVDKDLIIQEVVPGPDDQIFVAACYFDASSQPKATFVGRKLRQYPPRFGSACLAESLWDPEVARLSIEFLQAVRFVGLCGTEFKRDPRDGRLKMMEINPRPKLWMALTRATGVDVPYIAYQDLTGADVGPATQVDGVKWTYLARDLQSALYYLANRELSLTTWRHTMRGCKEEAILSRDDLRVALFTPFYAAARLARYLR